MSRKEGFVVIGGYVKSKIALWLILLTIAVGALSFGVVVTEGSPTGILTYESDTHGPGSPIAELADPGDVASGAPSSAFDPTERWDVSLTFPPIGLSDDSGPRKFGVHPNCTTGYDLQFINGEQCDRGRSAFFNAPYKTTFYYPNNPNATTSEDQTRLLTSRYNAGAGDFLTWPLRIEITGNAGGTTVSFSWKASEILSGPGSGDRPVVLKAGQLVSGQVRPVGDVLVDFRTGTGSGGVICQPTTDGHSCNLLTVPSGQSTLDVFYIILVGTLPGPVAVIVAPTSGDEGTAITFDGGSSKRNPLTNPPVVNYQ